MIFSRAFLDLFLEAVAAAGLDHLDLFTAKIERFRLAGGPRDPDMAATKMSCQRDGDNGEQGDGQEQFDESKAVILAPDEQSKIPLGPPLIKGEVLEKPPWSPFGKGEVWIK